MSSPLHTLPIISNRKDAAIHSCGPRPLRPLAVVPSAQDSPTSIPIGRVARLARWAHGGHCARDLCQVAGEHGLPGARRVSRARFRGITSVPQGRVGKDVPRSGSREDECNECQDSHAASVHTNLLGQVAQAGTLGCGGGRETAEGFGVSIQDIGAAVEKVLK